MQVNKSRQLYKKRETRIQQTIYSRCLLTRNITIPIVSVGKNIVETFEKYISKNYEGKCVVEGFVKPGSSKIITHSSGTIHRGIDVAFQVVFECDICFPVEGMLIQCVAKNITKAGIRADSQNENPSPIVVFIARDHNFSLPAFANIQEGDSFTARVIGQRFELNDKYVSIIAELTVPKRDRPPEMRQERLALPLPLPPLPTSTTTTIVEEPLASEVIQIVPKKRVKKIPGKIVVEASPE